jgi:hypothetical protein
MRGRIQFLRWQTHPKSSDNLRSLSFPFLSFSILPFLPLSNSHSFSSPSFSFPLLPLPLFRYLYKEDEGPNTIPTVADPSEELGQLAFTLLLYPPLSLVLSLSDSSFLIPSSPSSPFPFVVINTELTYIKKMRGRIQFLRW